MRITKESTAHKLAAFLHHEISLAELVDWSEQALMDGEFDEEHMAPISTVVARLGLADVRAFGLTWEDCEDLLGTLGYAARVEVAAV